MARTIEESQARRVALEHTIAEQRAQLATVVQQLHSFAEARQRQTGMAAPCIPGCQDGTITEDDIEVAFLQEKHRRAPSGTDAVSVTNHIPQEDVPCNAQHT